MRDAAPVLEFDAALQRGAFAFDATFAMADGITAIYGPSGSGKTTILNLVAGLLRPQRGQIAIGGEVVTDTRTRVCVPAHRRRLGVVFQDAHLFPHLTVAQNVAFGRWFSGSSKPGLELDSVARVLGIETLMFRRPSSLSGGERQRVALARALFANPRLLLMDEPLASLDTARREDILPLIEEVRDRFRVPILYVTHSAHEVRRLASRVVMLENGKVQAIVPPAQLLSA